MSDGFDAVAFDQDLTRERRVGLAVPNHDILHQRGSHGVPPLPFERYNREAAGGSFERLGFDAICPKAPARARDGEAR
jgi:hypothetical protein